MTMMESTSKCGSLKTQLCSTPTTTGTFPPQQVRLQLFCPGYFYPVQQVIK